MAQRFALALTEECLYGFLARMSERRVAHVVGKTCCTHNGAYLLKQSACKFGMDILQVTCHIVAKRHTHTCHLKRVGEAVVYKYAARQGKHLCLVLHTTEWSREYESVVVALEFGAVVMAFGMALFLSQSLVGYELLPVHCYCFLVILLLLIWGFMLQSY